MLGREGAGIGRGFLTLGGFLLRRWDTSAEALAGHSAKQQTKAKILFARFIENLRRKCKEPKAGFGPPGSLAGKHTELLLRRNIDDFG